jgi:hypothetical protein
MLTKPMTEILTRAALGKLPEFVDEHTAGIDLQAFKELYRGGLIAAVDASGDCGDGYLEPSITLLGRRVLEGESTAAIPWWASFDRRTAIVGLLVAVLSLAAGLGLLQAK